MKLSEYVKGLQSFLDKNGDMDAYCSSYDEGNNYQMCGYAGLLFYISEQEKKTYRPELIDGKDFETIEEYESGELTKVCVVN